MSQLPVPVNPDDQGRGPLVMGLTWTFAGVAIIAGVLRFYVRTKLAIGLALDDWLMFAAIACNIVSQSFVTIAYHHGLGKHDASLRPDQVVNVLKWMWLANTPGLIVSILARISIAVLLVRLFGGVHKWLKWFVIVVTGLCTILTVIILPCTYLQSTPVSGNWDPFTPAEHWNPKIYISLAYFCQALWTFTDLTFVLFPILVIWRLHMALRQRLGLVLLMSVSLFTMVLSILKTVGLKHIADQQADPTATDVLYGASLEILWSCLEQAFVIIMGCVPPLRSVVKLQLVRSISDSLASIIRRKKASKSSVDSPKYVSRAEQYENLEMSHGRLGRIDENDGLPYMGPRHAGSQQSLVGKDDMHSTPVPQVRSKQTWMDVDV
ncbi:integral membrane protein, partial [Metarhizium majus ARSEF 297]